MRRCNIIGRVARNLKNVRIELIIFGKIANGDMACIVQRLIWLTEEHRHAHSSTFAAVIFRKLNADILSSKNIYVCSKAETLLKFYVIHLDIEIKSDVTRDFRIMA